MSATTETRTYEQGYRAGFLAAQEGQAAVTRALHDGQYLHGLIRAIEWLRDRYEQCPGDPYPCNCEPHYESDTNAWDHAESCTQGAGDHFEALVAQAKERFAGVLQIHPGYPDL